MVDINISIILSEIIIIINKCGNAWIYFLSSNTIILYIGNTDIKEQDISYLKVTIFAGSNI